MLNITKKMLKKMDIENEDDLKQYELDYFEIINMVEDARFMVKNPSDFKSFCNIVKEEFGTFALFTYLYGQLTIDIYEEFGTYDSLYQNELLSSSYELADNGYLNTDRLRYIADTFTDLLEKADYFNESDIYKLREHFKNIRIDIDTRQVIAEYDTEHEELMDKIEQALTDSCQHIELDESSKIVFKNFEEGEIYNKKEIQEYNSELLELLKTLNIEDFISMNLHELFNNIIDEPLININLFVCCSANEVPKVTNNRIKCFSDMTGHPKYVLEEFKKTFARAQKDGTQVLIVETDIPYIVDYIRYLIYKGEAKLYNDVFKYCDYDNLTHILSITEEGKFRPNFPSGFFDITIQEIYEINKGGKND